MAANPRRASGHTVAACVVLVVGCCRLYGLRVTSKVSAWISPHQVWGTLYPVKCSSQPLKPQNATLWAGQAQAEAATESAAVVRWTHCLVGVRCTVLSESAVRPTAQTAETTAPAQPKRQSKAKQSKRGEKSPLIAFRPHPHPPPLSAFPPTRKTKIPTSHQKTTSILSLSFYRHGLQQTPPGHLLILCTQSAATNQSAHAFFLLRRARCRPHVQPESPVGNWRTSCTGEPQQWLWCCCPG